MNHHRYLISYSNPCLGTRRIAPFFVWAETEELAVAYAAQWVGKPLCGEYAYTYLCPAQTLAAA